jgi:hypothetical protein
LPGHDERSGTVALFSPGLGRSLERQKLDQDILAPSLCLSMISTQTRFAFVARENRFPLFRITFKF